MGESTELQKSIKVSEEVHEELANRKHGNESFDDVLKRVLGLVPRTVEELTDPLPERLATATISTVKDHIDEADRYRRIGGRDGVERTLEFRSPDSDRVIFKVSVFLPGKGRINNRVDIYYQSPQNSLERIAELRDTEDDAVDIEYTDFDTRKEKENTRRGENAGKKTADDVVGEHVSKFVDQANDVWG